MYAKFCVAEGGSRVGSGGKVVWEEIFREIFWVAMFEVDFVTDPGFAHEEGDGVAIACKEVGHGGAEGAATTDGDFGEGGFGGRATDARAD